MQYLVKHQTCKKENMKLVMIPSCSSCLRSNRVVCTLIACRKLFKQWRSIASNYSFFIAPPPICPTDKPPVNCFVDPCQFAKCPAHANAKCVSDFCGGCNARFFEDDEEVTDTCGELIIQNTPCNRSVQLSCKLHSLRLPGKGSDV